MERDNPNVTQSAADPVDETLERLEVADTLEDLRHHIDDLIARLSDQEKAAAASTIDRRVSGELEGQLENLGGKVDSASYLLAELADLLEAQTERIETIEQQLGDPDLTIGQRHSSATGEVPRFAMRPAQGAQNQTPPEPQTQTTAAEPPDRYAAVSSHSGAADPVEAIRRYLETRFERLEMAIHDVDKRIVEMRMVSDERERYVRELEERLLLLVETAPPGGPVSSASDDGGIRCEGRVPSRRAAAEPDVVHNLPRRPSHMPLFAHDAARAHRQIVRRAASVSPPPVPALRRDLRTTAEPEISALTPLSPDMLAGVPRIASYFTTRRSHDVAVGPQAAHPLRSTAFVPEADANMDAGSSVSSVVERVATPAVAMLATNRARQDIAAKSRAEAARSPLRNGGPSGTRPATAELSPATAEQAPRAMRELEKLVERDVSLHRDFRSGPGDTVRPAKAHPIVMVVDDAPDALTVLSIYLSKTGYQVVTANSAEDCLAKLRHHAIDAIVLDAKMPGASGEHVCRVLREDPAYAHRRDVPVIVYTGYPDDFPAEVRDEWKADEYVVKGGDMLPLMRALVRHTSRESTA